MKQQTTYGIIAVIAPFSFWVTNLYVGQYDGWGQWAAAPILLIPLLYSLIITISGLVMATRLYREKESCRTIGILVIVAVSPWIYTLNR